MVKFIEPLQKFPTNLVSEIALHVDLTKVLGIEETKE